MASEGKPKSEYDEWYFKPRWKEYEKFLNLIDQGVIREKDEHTLLKIKTESGDAIIFTYDNPKFESNKLQPVKIGNEKHIYIIQNPFDAFDIQEEYVRDYIGDYILYETLDRIDISEVREFLPTVLRLLELFDLEAQQVKFRDSKNLDPANVFDVDKKNFYCLYSGKKLQEGFFASKECYTAFTKPKGKKVVKSLKFLMELGELTEEMIFDNAEIVIDHLVDLVSQLDKNTVKYAYLPDIKIRSQLEKIFSNSKFLGELKLKNIIDEDYILDIGLRALNVKQFKLAIDRELQEFDTAYSDFNFRCQLNSVFDLLKQALKRSRDCI